MLSKKFCVRPKQNCFYQSMGLICLAKQQIKKTLKGVVLRATPFRVLPGLARRGHDQEIPQISPSVMRLGRLAFATSITPSLHALEEVLCPTQAKLLLSKYGPNLFS